MRTKSKQMAHSRLFLSLDLTRYYVAWHADTKKINTKALRKYEERASDAAIQIMPTISYVNIFCMRSAPILYV